MREYIFSFAGVICLVILSGCQSPPVKTRAEAESYLEKYRLHTIFAHCEFFNLEGKVIRRYPGELCVPFENGDLVVSDDKSLTKLDKNNKVLWSKPERAHHQLKLSYNKSDVYFVSSVYKKEKADWIRYDLVKVVDSEGKVIKSFEFQPYIENQKKLGKKLGLHKNIWTHDEYKNKSFEHTHVNSIQEMLRTNSQGQVELQGYVVNDRTTRMVFILDPGLQEIKSLIPMSGEVLHDVSFISEDEFVYYANRSESEPPRSYIGLYNIKNSDRRKIFGEKDPPFYSEYNGGVQFLSDKVFFITHSPQEARVYAELIADGRSLRKFWLKGSKRLVQDAKLGDYSSFLKQNIGN